MNDETGHLNGLEVLLVKHNRRRAIHHPKGGQEHTIRATSLITQNQQQGRVLASVSELAVNHQTPHKL